MTGVDIKNGVANGDRSAFCARNHGPVHHDSVLQGVNGADFETMAAIANILLVGAGDALLQRIVALDLPRSHVVAALGCPQRGERFPSPLRIGLVPDGLPAPYAWRINRPTR